MLLERAIQIVAVAALLAQSVSAKGAPEIQYHSSSLVAWPGHQRCERFSVVVANQFDKDSKGPTATPECIEWKTDPERPDEKVHTIYASGIT